MGAMPPLLIFEERESEIALPEKGRNEAFISLFLSPQSKTWRRFFGPLDTY
jgi:hypothetical protein